MAEQTKPVLPEVYAQYRLVPAKAFVDLKVGDRYPLPSRTIGDANFGALIEPADTYSNVENGFGIVAGYQEDKLRITMPRDTVPPYWNPWDG